MKLSCQTNAWGGVVGHPAGVTSVKDQYYLTYGSTEEALEAIAAAGYQGFELFDGNIMEYAGRETEFRAMVERVGLELVGVYSGANFIYEEIFGEELSKMETAAEFAAQLGAKHLVVGGGGVRAAGTEERDYELVGKGLNQVVKLADKLGLLASFHPHLGTCAQTPEQIDKIFQHTSINFCPDTAHLQAGGGDPAALIRKYSDRIKFVHLKDYQDGSFLPLGQGSQDLPDILTALKEIEYGGWIGVELDGYEGDAQEGAKDSRLFLEAWYEANA